MSQLHDGLSTAVQVGPPRTPEACERKGLSIGSRTSPNCEGEEGGQVTCNCMRARQDGKLIGRVTR